MGQVGLSVTGPHGRQAGQGDPRTDAGEKEVQGEGEDPGLPVVGHLTAWNPFLVGGYWTEHEKGSEGRRRVETR